jgi:hypothetical protein
MKIAKPTSHNMASTPRPARHGVNAKSARHSVNAKSAPRAPHNNGASLMRFRKLFAAPELAHLTMRQRVGVAMFFDEERFDVDAAKRALLILIPAPSADRAGA